jgi:hypothetical protein
LITRAISFQEEIWTAMSASQPPSSVRFEHVQRWGITMPLATDSPPIQGDVLAQTPPGLPLTRRSPGWGSLVGGSRRGSPCQARSATRSAAAPASGRARSTFGPHAIGAERFPTVTGGSSFTQVAGAILQKQARVQNPDKDEVPGSSPGRPTTQPSRSRSRRPIIDAGSPCRVARFVPPACHSQRRPPPPTWLTRPGPAHPTQPRWQHPGRP